MRNHAVLCQAKARARQTVAAGCMLRSCYIGHSWPGVGMSAAAEDPSPQHASDGSLLSLPAPLMACHM